MTITHSCVTVEVDPNSVFCKYYPGIYTHAITRKLVAAMWCDNPTRECRLVPMFSSWERIPGWNVWLLYYSTAL